MLVRSWPTHLDLPETDGLPGENDYQPSQARLLTSAIEPLIEAAHPSGDYFIGEDVGIYWKTTADPFEGCKVPDWCYIPGCAPSVPGDYRRSFVLWDEGVAPMLVIEFVSGDGSEEHDDTPVKGRFWVYRRGIRTPYYAIYDPLDESIELFHLDGVDYRPVAPNEHGLYEIPQMGVALGLWKGKYGHHKLTWLRFYWPDGRLIPHERERTALEKSRVKEEKKRTRTEKQRAEQEKRRAELEQQRADKEKRRADKSAAELADLVARLRAKGIDPGSLERRAVP